MKFAIVGCPNSGKTTLYNMLTSSSEHVGNWHGVTTQVVDGKFSCFGQVHQIYDLPGLNSFEVGSLEEGVSKEFLLKKDYDAIIYVIEALRFNAAVNLLEDLVRLKKPIVVLINMYKDLRKRGGLINDKLLKELGLNCFIVDLNSEKSRASVKALIVKNSRVIDNFDKNVLKGTFTAPRNIFTKTDRFLTNPFLATTAFILSFAFIFYIAFGNYGIGVFCADLISDLFDKVSCMVSSYLTAKKVTPFLIGLVCNGIFSGVGSIFAFLPPVTIVYFFLSYLEQSGIIARLSCVLNPILSKVGLNGRAAFSLLMGYGCTTLAVTTARGMENYGMKRRLIFALPLINCSAKLPVYFYLAEKLSNFNGFLLVCIIYLLSALLTVLFLYVKFKCSKDKSSMLIMELPILRLNCFKNLLKPLIKSVKQFIIKISTVLLCVSVAVYLLGSVNISVRAVGNGEGITLLSLIGGAITKILSPIGIKNSAVGSALFAGIFAKEAILSTLSVVGENVVLSWQSLIALSVMISVFPPCIVALDAIKEEEGLLSAVKTFVVQTVLGICCSYLTYFLLSNLGMILPVIVVLFVVFKVIVGRNENVQRKRE